MGKADTSYIYIYIYIYIYMTNNRFPQKHDRTILMYERTGDAVPLAINARSWHRRDPVHPIHHTDSHQDENQGPGRKTKFPSRKMVISDRQNEEDPV